MSTDIVLHIPDTTRLRDTIAVVEHYLPSRDGTPPRCVFVGQCKLPDVYTLSYAKSNKRWMEIFGDGGAIIIRIVHITRKKMEAARIVSIRRDQHTPRPECNLMGMMMFRKTRAIRNCTDGTIYRTQAEAARSLGITQASVSMHLSGRVASVGGGHILEYVQNEIPKENKANIPALHKMAQEI